MKRINIFAVMLLFAFGFFSKDMLAQRPGKRNFRGQQRSFWTQLNEDQKQELEEKIKELRDAGKTRQAVHAEIGTLLQSFGVELPDNWTEMPGRGRMGRSNRGGFFTNLTEDQRKEIRDKRKELREKNAPPEEIQVALKVLFDRYGIEVPKDFSFRARSIRRGFGLRGGFSAELTEYQKDAIQNKMKELREQQASRKEIHAAVGEMLQNFGIELPENWEEGPQFRKGRGHQGRFWAQLNEEQKEELNSQNSKTEGLQARNYPNPFNPETSIEFFLQKPEKVLLRVFNVTGQLVRTLLNTEQTTGTHTVQWDGRNENGMLVPSGLYFYRIDTGAISLTQGMILMK